MIHSVWTLDGKVYVKNSPKWWNSYKNFGKGIGFDKSGLRAALGLLFYITGRLTAVTEPDSVTIIHLCFLGPFETPCKKKSKTNVLYLSVNVFSRKVRAIGDTILRLLLETGLPFYVVIRAPRRSSHLQGEGSTFISLLF